MPPVRGNAEATSAKVSAPQSARMPPTTHTAINAVGVGSRFAIAAGERKMPEPMVVPTTTTSASTRPIRRGSASDRGDSRKETDLSTGVPEENRLVLAPAPGRHPTQHRGQSLGAVCVVDEEPLGARRQALSRAREVGGNTVALPHEFVRHHEPG